MTNSSILRRLFVPAAIAAAPLVLIACQSSWDFFWGDMPRDGVIETRPFINLAVAASAQQPDGPLVNAVIQSFGGDRISLRAINGTVSRGGVDAGVTETCIQVPAFGPSTVAIVVDVSAGDTVLVADLGITPSEDGGPVVPVGVCADTAKFVHSAVFKISPTKELVDAAGALDAAETDSVAEDVGADVQSDAPTDADTAVTDSDAEDG